MMFKGYKRLILSLVLVLLGTMVIGCSGDSPVDELTEGVEGPSQVIVNEESDQFVATGPTGSDYVWQVDGDGLGIFTAPQSAKTKFKPTQDALAASPINIRALINSEPKDWMEIEVLSSDSKTEYAKGTFHSIAATDDKNYDGYIAAGTIGVLGENNKPYMVKADNRGLTIDEKEFDRGGRFYDVQDFVRTARGDYYYLIGYGTVSNGVSEAFVLELNKNMEINKEYASDSTTDSNAYLRSGIIAKNLFASDHVIAVGNKQVASGYAPYIVDVDTSKEDGIEHHILDSSYGYDFSNPYYNLESIVETSDGYLAVGYTNDTKESRTGAEGIRLTLDKDLQVKSVKTNITEKLYKIKKVEDNKFVVIGDQGYITEVNSSGTIINSGTNLESDIVWRDVIVDGSNYITVGKESGSGVVAKINSSDLSLESTFSKTNYGDYLFGVAKATDGDYLLAGYSTSSDGTTNSYVVKVNSIDSTVVNRVKE